MDVLIDVGGEFNAETHRYDHHQRGFAEVFGHGFDTKLSSAGLVYKHFGREIIAGVPPEHCSSDASMALTTVRARDRSWCACRAAQRVCKYGT